MQDALRLRCYVFGHDTEWEAICVDLDIAVAAASRQEARAMLEKAVRMHVEAALAEPPEIRRRLLNRKAPFFTRMQLFLALLWSLRAERRARDDREGYTLPCPV